MVRVRYVGAKPIKYDTVNDPRTAYTWSEDNGYVVEMPDDIAARFLKHEYIWQTDVGTDETPGETEVEAPDEAPEGRKRKG